MKYAIRAYGNQNLYWNGRAWSTIPRLYLGKFDTPSVISTPLGDAQWGVNSYTREHEYRLIPNNSADHGIEVNFESFLLFASVVEHKPAVTFNAWSF